MGQISLCMRKYNQFIDLNLDDICEQHPSFVLNQATPIGGVYYINEQTTNYFDIENLDIGGYNIKYEYTDSSTLCLATKEQIVYIHPKPEALFTFNPKIIKDIDTEVYFTSENIEDIAEFHWYIMNNIDTVLISDSINFWYKFDDIGKQYIQLVVEDIYGCTDTLIDSLEIIPNVIIYVPTAFTPNDDNINDLFGPTINNFETYQISIYNKWGGLIFEGTNEPWDGKINDNIAPIGIYFYSIEVMDMNNMLIPYHGNVILTR